MRVNARFEGVAEQQVAYLAATMDLSVSEVLRLSVQEYYNKVRGKAPALHHFGKHIGRYNSGHTDTSVRYKEVVAEALDKKYPRQPYLQPHQPASNDRG
jgi:hypothetical protein